MHYVNKNEDVLVSFNENNIPEGFYKIPHIDSSSASMIINNNIFIAAKCYALAYNEFPNESTQAITFMKWLEANKFKDSNSFSIFNKELIDDLNYYINYDSLNLSYLYGGNRSGFNILEPFIIPKDYIVDSYCNYDDSNIEDFINDLVNEGYVTFK